MQNKNNSKAGAICTLLVITALVVGIVIGIFIGRSMNTDPVPPQTDHQSQAESQDERSSENQSQNTSDASEPLETVPETLESGSGTETASVVISVNGRDVTMEAVNYYLYTTRDYYVGLYGEEPWGQTMEDGRTVAEFAKEELYNQIVETQILASKAGDYGVALTGEISAQYADEAQTYIDNLGPEICEQFGLSAAGIQKVYEDGGIQTEVYKAIIADLTAQMKEDEAYSQMSDEEFDMAVTQAYSDLYQKWLGVAQVRTTEIWDSIVVGSVG